ncbi:MAG: VWA domain-containing protein, partial [Planctomycetota bacterium]
MVFEQPVWLLASVVVAPLLAVGWWRFGSMGRARRLSALGLRALLATMLAGLLAGATWVGETRRIAVVVVADVSESVRSFGPQRRIDDETGEVETVEALDRVAALLDRLAEARGPDDRVGLVVAGERSLASVLPTRGRLDQAALDLDVGVGTDLASGVLLAAALAPADAATRVLVVSDGVETSGDAVRSGESVAAGGALGAGVRVDVAPIRYRVEREVAVESLDVPPRAPSGARVTARVVLRSTGPTEGRLRLLRDGEPMELASPEGALSRAVSLRGGVTTVLLPVELPAGRVHRLEAVFEADDPTTDRMTSNNRSASVTLTPGDGSILVLSGGGVREDRLIEALRAADLRVEVRSPVSAPTDL